MKESSPSAVETVESNELFPAIAQVKWCKPVSQTKYLPFEPSPSLSISRSGGPTKEDKIKVTPEEIETDHWE